MEGEVIQNDNISGLSLQAQKKLHELKTKINEEKNKKETPGESGERMANTAFWEGVLKQEQNKSIKEALARKNIDALSEEEIYFILKDRPTACRHSWEEYNTMRKKRGLPAVGYHKIILNNIRFLESPHDNSTVRVPLSQTGTATDGKGNIISIPSLEDLREIIRGTGK